MAEFVSQRKVGRGAVASDDAERVRRETCSEIRQRVRDTARLTGFHDHRHDVRAGRVAERRDLVQEPVVADRHAREIGHDARRFGISDFVTRDEAHTLKDSTLRVGRVRLGERQVDQRFHRRGSAFRRACERGPYDHDVDDRGGGERARSGDGSRRARDETIDFGLHARRERGRIDTHDLDPLAETSAHACDVLALAHGAREDTIDHGERRETRVRRSENARPSEAAVGGLRALSDRDDAPVLQLDPHARGGGGEVRHVAIARRGKPSESQEYSEK